MSGRSTCLLPMILALVPIAGCSPRGAVPAARLDTIVVPPDTLLGAIIELTPHALRIGPPASGVTGPRLIPEVREYARLTVRRVGLDATHCKEEYDRAAMQWNGTAAEPSVSRDTVFTKDPSQVGVHARQLGTVVDLTNEDLTLAEAGGGYKIYSREVVRRVGLDDAHCADVEDKVASYWNRTKSRLVGSVQKAPVVGPYLGMLDGLPAGVDSMFAALMLVLALGYGGYRVYETVIVARGVRDLNLTKLRLEIDELRRKLATGGGGGGGEAVRAAPEDAGRSWQLPEVHFGHFFKYKVLRLPTAEAMQARTDEWAQRWTAYRERRRWLPATMYRFWSVSNGALSVFAASLGVMTLVDVWLPLTMPEEFGGGGVGLVLIFAWLSVLCWSWFLRLRVRGRIITATYREFRRSG